MTTIRSLAAALAFALPTSAQIAIAPIDQTDPAPPAGGPYHLEGDSSSANMPFGAGIARIQYIYETSDAGRPLLAIPHGHQITALSYPAELGANSPGGVTLLLEVVMAHTDKTTANAETTFANNYASPPVVVFPQQQFTLPHLATQPLVTVPLSTPFAYDANRHLLVEFRIHANSNGNQPFGYVLDAADYRSPVQTSGTGCVGSNGRPATLMSSPTALTQPLLVTATDLSIGNNAALLVAFDSLPAQLPIPGAPGCTLGVVPIASATGVVNQNGWAQWSLPVGDDIALWHLHVHSQVLALDLFANPLGVVATNVVDVEIGIPPRIARITASGSASAPVGSILRTWGQVTYFHHQ